MNPATGGPGYWIYGHRLSRKATTATGIARFLDYLDELSTDLPFAGCRNEFQQLLRQYPPMPHLWLGNSNDTTSAFAWFVARHNDTNRRLGKPEVTVEEARQLYSEDHEGCAVQRRPANSMGRMSSSTGVVVVPRSRSGRAVRTVVAPAQPTFNLFDLPLLSQQSSSNR